MSAMQIYVSGPIAGYPNFREVFDNAAQRLVSLGHRVVNPVNVQPWEHSGECPSSYTSNQGHSAACWLRGDLMALLPCDAVFMLPGWESSIGARLEFSVAAHCGMKIFYSGGELPPKVAKK